MIEVTLETKKGTMVVSGEKYKYKDGFHFLYSDNESKVVKISNKRVLFVTQYNQMKKSEDKKLHFESSPETYMDYVFKNGGFAAKEKVKEPESVAPKQERKPEPKLPFDPDQFKSPNAVDDDVYFNKMDATVEVIFVEGDSEESFAVGVSKEPLDNAPHDFVPVELNMDIMGNAQVKRFLKDKMLVMGPVREHDVVKYQVKSSQKVKSSDLGGMLGAMSQLGGISDASKKKDLSTNFQLPLRSDPFSGVSNIDLIDDSTTK